MNLALVFTVITIGPITFDNMHQGNITQVNKSNKK